MLPPAHAELAGMKYDRKPIHQARAPKEKGR